MRLTEYELRTPELGSSGRVDEPSGRVDEPGSEKVRKIRIVLNLSEVESLLRARFTRRLRHVRGPVRSVTVVGPSSTHVLASRTCRMSSDDIAQELFLPPFGACGGSTWAPSQAARRLGTQQASNGAAAGWWPTAKEEGAAQFYQQGPVGGSGRARQHWRPRPGCTGAAPLHESGVPQSQLPPGCVGGVGCELPNGIDLSCPSGFNDPMPAACILPSRGQPPRMVPTGAP